MTPTNPWLAGFAMTGAVVAMFVGFVLVSKLGLRTQLGPWDLAAIRFVVAGTVMLPMALRHGLLGLGPVRALGLACSGGLGFALCAYWGFALAPASHGSALIHGTLPLTTVLMTWVLVRRRPGRWQTWSALTVAAGATAMLATSLLRPEGQRLEGDLLLLTASLCWSTFGVLSHRWRPVPLRAAALVAVMSALLFLPPYLLSSISQIRLASWTELVQQAVFQGLVIGVGSIFVYAKAVATVGPAVTALAAATVPALTALGGVLLLDESLAWPEGIGLALVTTGIALGAGALERTTSGPQTTAPHEDDPAHRPATSTTA